MESHPPKLINKVVKGKEETITLKKGGVLELPSQLLQLLGFRERDKLTAITIGNKCLQLLKLEDDILKMVGDGYKIVLTGDLKGIGVADLLSTLNMARKTGVLVVVSGKIVKSVYFRQGEIIFASSSQKEERLGNILYRTGRISREQRKEAERDMKGGKRFGSILLEKEFIGPKDLFWGVKYQIEEIIYSVFQFQTGFFFFVEGDMADEDLVRFSFNTQKLLMEGFRRMDEWPLIRRFIPSQDAIVEIIAAPGPGDLNPTMQQILEFVDGEREVKEIIRLSQLGEFNGVRILYQLAKAEIIRAKEKDIGEGGEVEAKREEEEREKIKGIVEKYNLLFSRMHTALSDHLDIKETIDSFFADVNPRFQKLFEGVEFDSKGSLNPEQITKNAKKAELSDTGAFHKITGFSDLFTFQLVLDGLNEFLNFLIFSLRSYSEGEETEEVIRQVRLEQGKIRKR